MLNDGSNKIEPSPKSLSNSNSMPLPTSKKKKSDKYNQYNHYDIYNQYSQQNKHVRYKQGVYKQGTNRKVKKHSKSSKKYKEKRMNKDNKARHQYSKSHVSSIRLPMPELKRTNSGKSMSSMGPSVVSSMVPPPYFVKRGAVTFLTPDDNQNANPFSMNM